MKFFQPNLIIAIAPHNGDDARDDEISSGLLHSVRNGLWIGLIRVKRADDLQVGKGLIQIRNASPGDFFTTIN